MFFVMSSTGLVIAIAGSRYKKIFGTCRKCRRDIDSEVGYLIPILRRHGHMGMYYSSILISCNLPSSHAISIHTLLWFFAAGRGWIQSKKGDPVDRPTTSLTMVLYFGISIASNCSKDCFTTSKPPCQNAALLMSIPAFVRISSGEADPPADKMSIYRGMKLSPSSLYCL